mgnify:CR=1 FL=1
MADFLDVVKHRRSIRKFQDATLSPDEVVAMMTPVLFAPSSKGKQAVEFILVEQKDMLELY